MPQVRVDPLSGLKTIIAGARADRPNSGFNATPEPPVDPTTDPFLPGHEDQTPPTLYTDGDPWRVRVFDNLYPALVPAAEAPERDANPDLFTAQPAAGAHEVIVNAPEPVSTLSELSVEQLALAVATWRERMRAPRLRRLPAPDRQRGPRRGRVDPAHPRAALRHGLRARGRRP